MKNKKNNSASTFSDALDAMNDATENGTGKNIFFLHLIVIILWHLLLFLLLLFIVIILVVELEAMNDATGNDIFLTIQ